MTPTTTTPTIHNTLPSLTPRATHPIPPTPSSSPPSARHPDFYFSDGNIILSSDNTLYSVHRSVLTRHSDAFRDMIEILDKEGCGQGESDANPMKLPGARSYWVELLLSVLYPRVIGQIPQLRMSEWLLIQALAQNWRFKGIQELALSKISELARSPFDKIQIAGRFGIRKEWILEGYVEICKRKEALSLAEAKVIMGDEMTEESLLFLKRVIQTRELIRPLVSQLNPSLIQLTVAKELGIPYPVSNSY